LFLLALTLVVLGTLGLGSRVEQAQDARAKHSTPDAATFYRDVLPILQTAMPDLPSRRRLAPMRFETYEQTRPYALAIAAAALNKSMPPWFADPHVGHFSNDPSLSAGQIAALLLGQMPERQLAMRNDAPAAPHWRRVGALLGQI